MTVPEEVLLMLRRASDGRVVGILTMEPEDTPEDMRMWKAWLRAGARRLGGQVRFQDDPGEVRYEVWGMSA